jgi:hypothetical protein
MKRHSTRKAGRKITVGAGSSPEQGNFVFQIKCYFFELKVSNTINTLVRYEYKRLRLKIAKIFK